MIVSLEWLKDFANLDGINPHALADKLTMSGNEVEAVCEGVAVQNIVTAYVEHVEKHPDADKLNVCKVRDGEEVLQVVCGAPNVRAGLTVAFARVGAVLPGDFKIKKAKIRGVESFGMICSESELGISEESNGIMELPANTPLGADVNELFNIGNTTIEIGITPNRADCLSILGVAKEIGALYGKTVTCAPAVVKESDEAAASVSGVEVLNETKCPIYLGRIIKGVKVAPSPQWLQNRLRAVGVRPINNVVDITNYVLFGYGQPLHTFDLRMVKDKIVVRDAKPGEKILTLDGKERELQDDMLVIADTEKVLAVAGVMGGEYSGITEDTTDVFLECAYFQPESVRMTARRLGMSSDSSYRYERGIDGGATPLMVDIAANLIQEICGGTILKGVLSNAYTPIKKRVVNGSVSGINALLGTSLDRPAMIDILNRLGMTVSGDGDTLVVEVPTNRVDIERNVDLGEEVARVYGYDNIPTTTPVIESDSEPLKPELRERRLVSESLMSLGFSEVINYSFMNDNYLANFDKKEKFVYLLNPLSEDWKALRTMVFPGTLGSLKTNWNNGFRNLRLFEFANTFEKTDAVLPTEELNLCIACMGQFWPMNWNVTGGKDVDPFFYLKGIVENVLSRYKLNVSFARSERMFLHPGKSAEIMIDGVSYGYFGELHPDMQEAADLKEKAYVAEIFFGKLLAEKCVFTYKYAKFSKFPFVYKDISVVVKQGFESAALAEKAKTVSPLIDDVILFDVYTGKGIEADEASITYRITFSDPTKTLTDEETNGAVSQILALLEKEFGARLR